MAVVYSNNASTALSSGITNSATSITVGSVAGFPTLTGSDYYYATLANVTNTKIEIVKVTAAVGTTLTVVRGQDNTTAVSFDASDNLQLRVTAATLESATSTDVVITGGSVSTATITDATASAKGLATAAQITKLDAIEASADVTDTTNVTAAGALMDSELASIAAVKATTGTFLTADQSKLDAIEASANNYTHPTGAGYNHIPTGGSVGQILKNTASGTATWQADNNTTYSVGDGGLTEINFTSADHSKLNGIESGATADQTAAQIKTLLENGIDSVHYVDGSIDRVHLAADIIDGTKIASDVINSEHYVAGSIDNEHIADNAISSEHYANNSIDALHLNVSGNGTTSEYLRSDGDGSMSWVTPPDTNTTYSADGNYGMTLSGTTFRLENDRRRNSTGEDVWSGNTHDYTHYDESHGIRWYTEGSEEMRLENDGDLHVDGNVTAYSTTVSDRNLKTDIKNIDNALDKVNKLNGCTFTYTSDGKESAGLIAQEVEEVLPSAVTTSKLVFHGEEGKEYKVLQYDQTIGLLVEAIKELSAKVEELENK